MSDVLTVEQFQLALPEKVKKSVHQGLIDQVNKTLAEPELYEIYRDNLLSYAKVMQDGRFKVDEYVNAVKYVSHKLMGATNIEAYSKTFPDRITKHTANGTSAKDIASYVTAYNKSKLVNLIFEQSIIPTWVLNQDMFQKALNVQFGIMNDEDVSAKVRVEAANSLLTHLKPPEVKKVELDIGVKEDSSIAELRKATLALARQQQEAIAAGAVTARETAHARIIDVSAVEVK